MKQLDTLFPAYLSRLFADVALPKWVASGGLGLLQYVAPSTAPRVFFATCGLVVIDTITGVVRAKATGQEVTSAKAIRFLTKSFTYAIALGTIALACDAIPGTRAMHPGVVTTLLTGISITETKSIFENLNAIRPDLAQLVSDSLGKLLPKKADPSQPPQP